jgi:capsular polysaccharide biosynthesis protein
MQNYYEDEIDLREIFAVLWKWKWTIIGVTLAFMVLAFAYSKFFVDPIYEARAVVIPANLNHLNGSSLTYVVDAEKSLEWQLSEDIKSTLKLPQVSIYNLNALLMSNHVLSGSRQALSLDHQSLEEIRERVKTNYDTDTGTTEIVVSGTDPQENSALANELVNQIIAYVRELNQEYMNNMIATLESQLEQAESKLTEAINNPQAIAGDNARRDREIERREQIVDLLSGKLIEVELLQSSLINKDEFIVLSPATPPKAPVAPRVMLNTAIAAVLGFMLVIFAVFIVEYMRSTPSRDKSAG